MKVKILDKRWDLRFVHNLTNRGDCDPPSAKNKQIRVGASLTGEERLEIIIHEFMHAADWKASEDFVREAAEDLARILTRLGYSHKNDDNC